ncbi:hypothetical protein NY406_00150 [Chlorobaculum sp. MV4-Y]|uniref:hypothetical protein n=1 Tax=Chlorobaculum sp. MV4-Y TaxID=2976335 RepID=UPI0021AFEB77|nr:hypothetical protein [Chlorobaculum sp. MV4-Y]UWX58801.1 hypothetical protein NY406_00150 [Chlorobaculum sp. MV4-Y]
MLEMTATGKSKGQWMFYRNFDHTVDYLSDHQKILAFNPFCHKVEPLDRDEAYRWHFRVTDPQNNPFDVIFDIQQENEILVDLPDEIASMDPEEMSDEMIRQFTVGRKITWRPLTQDKTFAMPEKYLFEGKVTADMLIVPVQQEQTTVDFDLRVNVAFLLYPAFRIVPEKVVRTMVSTGMSLIMQTATNHMFQKISKDFGKIRKL